MISRISQNPIQNLNPFIAYKEFIRVQEPIIFDIGMNHGQTLKKIQKEYPNAQIHGFEPNSNCFLIIKEQTNNNSNLHLDNVGLGNELGYLEFNEYDWDAMSSFLKRSYGKASINQIYKVKVDTIDNYCSVKDIKRINILKSDTEGFELKVLEGAQTTLKLNKIQFIFLELFWNENFIGQSNVGEIFSFLEKYNFSLVRFYDFSLTDDGLASKSDALFVNKFYMDE